MKFFTLIALSTLTMFFVPCSVQALENKDKLAQIQEFKDDLESCEKEAWKALDQKYNGQSKDNTPDSQIVINEGTCYATVGNKVIDTFYFHTNEGMKKKFDALLRAFFAFYGELYAYNASCYNPGPENRQICGNIALDFATADDTYFVKNTVMDMLKYTESFYK
jgi:hypothetical protein